MGWLREEFEALHAPFDARGALTDEYLRICKALWTEELVTFPGPRYHAPAVRGRPKPHQRPHPPIWIGGNSRSAIRRAARLGDGWHPIDLSPGEIARGVTQLHADCTAVGRRAADLTVSLRTTLRLTDADDPGGWLTGPVEKVRANVAAYIVAGVQYLVINLRYGTTVDDMVVQLDRVATEVFQGDTTSP